MEKAQLTNAHATGSGRGVELILIRRLSQELHNIVVGDDSVPDGIVEEACTNTLHRYHNIQETGVMQLTFEQEQSERENAEHLASIGDVDVEVGRRVLRKFKGDMAKAADAILSGDRAIEAEWESQKRTTPEPAYTNTVKAALPSSTSVIDLTADDDDMTRAIQMSMETSSGPPQFGPTERAPHPEWQMDPVGAMADEDQTLNEAIQASLQDFKEDADMLSPLKNAIREGGRPIAVRANSSSYAYAALVLQALYYVPQVRLTCSNLRLPEIEPNVSSPDPNSALWNLIELFTNLDLAQIATIVDANAIPSLDIPAFNGVGSLADASSEAVKSVAMLIEEHMEAQAGDDEIPEHLFSFKHGKVVIRRGHDPRYRASPDDGSVVTVEYGGHNPYNELIACISDSLSKYHSDGSDHDIIIAPSTVLTFLLRRNPVPPGAAKSSSDPFVYPKTIYLDRFLVANLELTIEKRTSEQKLLGEIQVLKEYRNKLTRLENGSDALDNLRTTIFYYENVADPDGDPTRKRNLQRTADHLKDIMTMINGKVEDIDHKIETLQVEVGRVYDCPELQRFRYDLRGVLFHTGLFGAKQMYSYVQDMDGHWWKTVDQDVTEVSEETVLTDPTGIHLGAGPYMLFYSRHMSDELRQEPVVWPSLFSEAVEENNKRFLAMMHPEVEMFSSTRSSPDPVASVPATARELASMGERKATGVSRQSSRAMEDSIAGPSSKH